MTPEPVVVLSAPHSQAAHVAALLGGHPRALALPEMRLFSCDSVEELLTLPEHGNYRCNDGLLRAIAFLFYGGQQPRHITAAQRFLEHRRDWRTSVLLEHILDRVAPRVTVLHDITAPLHIVELDRWFAATPSATFLHLLRHPVTFSEAAKQALQERLHIPPDYSDHSGYPQLAPHLLWFRVHDTLRRELTSENNTVFSRQLRLEDWQQSPHSMLNKLCRWLGWHHDDKTIEAMTRTFETPFAGYGPENAPTGAEATFLENPEFTVPLGARAQSGRLAQSRMPQDIIELAREIGYS